MKSVLLFILLTVHAVVFGQGVSSSSGIDIQPDSTGINVKVGEEFLLRYQVIDTLPPVGVDLVYRKSGFIHPLNTPSGFTLTRVQPPDHYHHYGIWSSWTRTWFEGNEVDFWNLNKKQGKVSCEGVLSIFDEDVFAGFRVVHHHRAYPGSIDLLAMVEEVEVRVYPPVDARYRVWDYISTVIPVQPGGIVLKEYRYGGFVLRGNESWTNETSRIITSEGRTRLDADGQRAKWCMITGNSPAGQSGILIMGHPGNYNAPQPLRVWPPEANKGRGDVFVNFSPTRDRDWELEMGKRYRLVYRVVVFDGKLNPEEIALLWDTFSR